MRIVLIGQKWDYGVPSRGYGFGWYTFYKSLQADGHDVLLVDAVNYSREHSPREVDQMIRRAVSNAEPQIVLSILSGQEVPLETLAYIRDHYGVAVVNWFTDDHWQYEEFSRHVAPSLTLSVTTSSLAADRYDKDGFPYFFSQWGYAHKVYGQPEVTLDPERQFAFVGQMYGNRSSYLDYLTKGLGAGAEIVVYGFQTAAGRISIDHMLGLFSRSIATLNFSGSWSPRLLYKLSRGRLQRPPSQLKARVFEVTGRGGVVVTEPSDDLPRYFIPGREVLVFHSRRELLDMTRELLSNGALRQQIAEAGRSRCLADHTMSQRFAEVFDAVLGRSEGHTDLRPRLEGPARPHE